VNALRYSLLVEKRLKGGLFSALVLHVIGSSDDPIHGYGIIRNIESWSGGTLVIKAGTLYPILSTLESHGLVTHEKVRSKEGPPKNVYSMTMDGYRALEQVNLTLDRILTAVEQVRCCGEKPRDED